MGFAPVGGHQEKRGTSLDEISLFEHIADLEAGTQVVYDSAPRREDVVHPVHASMTVFAGDMNSRWIDPLAHQILLAPLRRGEVVAA